MSGGKKKIKKQKTTFTIGEVRRMMRENADDAVKRNILISVVAARDEFDLDEDGIFQFLTRIQRYAGFEDDGLVNLKDFSDSLYANTGIDLRLRRF